MIEFLRSNLPDSLLVTFGPVAVHWYGLLMVIAACAGYYLVKYWWKRYTCDTEGKESTEKGKLDDLVFFLLVWGFVGARLYHVLNEPAYYFHQPFEVFAFWNGGLAIHGALIAGVIVLFWFAKQRFFFIADILVVGLAVGQTIGRWGNYFNQELYGRPTNLPWGIPIDAVHRVAGFEQFTYFHPTFLYESAGSFIILLVVWAMHVVRTRRKMQIEDFRFRAGNIFSAYMVMYSLLRILVELFRIDDVPIVFGIRLPILTSCILIFIGIFFLIHRPKIQGSHVKSISHN